jgi:hypothetical protein
MGIPEDQLKMITEDQSKIEDPSGSFRKGDL